MLDRAAFATTLWTVVLNAKAGTASESARALETLCETYWYPLYAFVRRLGYNAHDSQDLTQEFFTRFIAKNYLDDVVPERGRFRSFLLASLKHFLADEWDKACALKRGGAVKFIPFDLEATEERYVQESNPLASPEALYDRKWALALLNRALTRLETEFSREGKPHLFERLKPFLLGAPDSRDYAQHAQEAAMSQGALKVAVHRLRKRYRELLRDEVAETVATAEQVQDEMRYLLTALGR